MKNFNIDIDNLSMKEKKQLMELINKANQRKRWKAEAGQEYYCVDEYNNKIKCYLMGVLTNDGTEDETDKYLYKFGNYFKTKEEAEFELNRRLVYQELKDYALEHNEKDIDWSNPKSYKWFITYSHSIVGGVLTDCNEGCQGLGQIYFNSQKVARDAIQSVGEDRIKKYLFDVN